MAKKKAPVWVEIIFHSGCPAARHEDVLLPVVMAGSLVIKYSDPHSGGPPVLTIHFKTALDHLPKRHEGVTRVYAKAESFNVELAERDSDGRPVIVGYPLANVQWWTYGDLIGYPLANVFSWARPHQPHVGATPRVKG